MGQEEILRKLSDVLTGDIKNEYQVVYILSRIRKYLELKNKKSKYKYLNFYCNWALHTKLDRTEPVADVLRDFINHKDSGSFLKFEPLIKELKTFLNEYGLPDRIIEEPENCQRFLNILVDIYSDTPLEVYPEEKRIITITKPSRKHGIFGVSCTIT